MKKNIKGFTLIEVVVAITILSIIMISVFAIFSMSADLNNKVDISRAMQENIKNISQIISEDIRLNKVSGINSQITSSCDLSNEKFQTGTKLCLGSNSYYLAKKVVGVWTRVVDYSECELGKEFCYFVRDDGSQISQLSNSWMEFRGLYFTVFNSHIKKVNITFEVQPSIKKGIKTSLIKANRINFQTTISEKIYNN